MEITVLQENLQQAVTFVSKFVSTKTQLPILGNILLEGEEGRLRLSTTNLETSISFRIGATTEQIGALTVPARFFNEIVSTFNAEKVQLKTDKNTLIIKCGQSQASLSGIVAEEFPPFPKADKKKEIKFPTDVFTKGLPLVLISVSGDEGRPLLTGVKVSAGKDGTTLAATDGYRLSVKKLPSVSELGDSLVIPGRTLGEVGKMFLEEKVETINVSFSQDKNQIIFSLPQVDVATRMIEGEFPAYEKIIPATHSTKALFDKEELLRAIKLAQVYAKEAANIVKLQLTQTGVIVSANLPQIGENKTELDMKVEGEVGEIAFNARFILDLLAVFPENEIQFEMSGPLAPGVFRSVKDDSFIHIIMPVRVQN